MDAHEPRDERDGMEIDLPPELSDVVHLEQHYGRFDEPIALVREGLRRLDEEQRWRDELRAAIDVGWAQAEAGELLDPAEVIARLRARIEVHRKNGL